MKQSPADPIRTHQRKAAAVRRAGKNTRCACGETRVEALVPGKGLCAACNRTMKKQSTLDNHHVAGRRDSPVTVPIPVNDHRAILSEAQYDWPKATLENPDGCPLRWAAGCIRGFVDTVVYMIERLLRRIAEMLEVLSAFLVEHLGPEWWLDTPLVHFTRKA